MRLILFDDHKLFGSTLQKILIEKKEVESFDFVQTKEALNHVLQDPVNKILLLDINLRNAGVDDSFGLGEVLLTDYPELKLVFLSGYNLPMYRKKAKELGAKGFFSKEISLEDLISGLTAIERGALLFSREDGIQGEKCTATEIQVLQLAAKGLNRNEIGEQLYISNRTVGTHLSNIFIKLEVKNITEAIAVALEEGHIPPLV